VLVRIRSFADDFSTAVARHAHTTAAADFTVSDGNAAKYLEATIVLNDKDGRRIPLTFKSQRRTGDVIWLELESPSMALRGARVSNAMLFEVHRDQVNVVKATYAGSTFTTLFSVGDQAKALP
jgi:hypothetical protein